MSWKHEADDRHDLRSEGGRARNVTWSCSAGSPSGGTRASANPAWGGLRRYTVRLFVATATRRGNVGH